MAFRFLPEMSPQTTGIIIGGFVPAVMYATAGIFAKVSANAGMSAAGHLICAGVAVGVVGLGLALVQSGPVMSTAAIGSSFLFGALWALGSGAIVIAIDRYDVALAKLATIYNSNTLLAVTLSLIIFAEWQQVELPKLLVGAALIVVGGILVTLA